MQLLTFKLNKSKYAIKTEDVKEIIENKIDINKIPNTKSYIEGISNIRGEVIKIINLSEFLNTTRTQENLHIIITEGKDGKNGLLVDSVEKIVDEINLLSADLKLAENDNLFAKALIDKENEDIYLEINTEKLLNIPENKEEALA